MPGRWRNCSVSSETLGEWLVALFIFEIILGLLGNAIALWTFYSQVKIWKPYTIYLFNLVIADMLLMVCLPFLIDFFLHGKQWFFGDIFCRTMLFFLAFNRTGSIAFLTAVAVDRYFRVIHPKSKINRITSQMAKVVAILIWVLVVTFSVPILTTFQLDENTTECQSFHLRATHSATAIWHEFVFFAEFFVPFALLLFCTIAIVKRLRDRNMGKQAKVQRAVALLAAVVVLFVVCFMPSILARVAVLVLQRMGGCAAFSVAVNGFDVAIGLTFLNSAMDPVVYCFSSPTFRYSYKRALNTVRRMQLGPKTFDATKDSDT
ncbi:12-(S)-hydroxy-5,8,10,14-eicosatetraenoic acid receptor [Ambystoma mexicanum]|uniref:12-(S)-hydroxy-5,8,10,14-eicosatetraenoic acid receptor n=1 Tax=Ambystoma mexicanum TaxID=8296 RepID=UPI0037E86368